MCVTAVGGGDDLDDIELGERVSRALFQSGLGAMHPRVQDRAWSVVAHCAGTVARRLGYLPEEWAPALDSSGYWIMPPAEGGAR